MKRYLGVDLHKDVFTVCYLDEKDKHKIKEFKLTELAKFKKTLKPQDQIAVEAIANSRYFCEELTLLVEKVVMVAPGRFKMVSESCQKTDENDAVNLAEFLKMGKLPEARIMSKARALLKSALKTRYNFVRQRTQCKNKILNILNSLGLEARSGKVFSQKGLAAVNAYELEALTKLEIELLLRQIEALNLAIKELEVEIENAARQLPGYNNLISISGIGMVSAAIFIAVIGDIKDFPERKKLNAYIGLVPSVRQSNNTVHYGRITKQGNTMMRTALVQCAWVVIKYNTILRNNYLKLKQKKGCGKAIVATARKLLELIHYTLTNDIIWEDSNTGVMKSCNMAA
jgi:transposase